VASDATLWCAGSNAAGQFANGMAGGSNFDVPTPIASLSALSDAAIGGNFSCAVKSDGTLWCWGANASGQLGNGTTAPAYAPAEVAPLGHAVAQVSAGSEHACAVKTDGTLWCWGTNDDGQIGNGTRAMVTTPFHVAALHDVTRVRAGARTTCAALADGSLWCWGYNYYGQLGDGGAETQTSPVQVLPACP
jgi:alpha-tubulin suppressor-like RCC1 family protein